MMKIAVVLVTIGCLFLPNPVRADEGTNETVATPYQAETLENALSPEPLTNTGTGLEPIVPIWQRGRLLPPEPQNSAQEQKKAADQEQETPHRKLVETRTVTNNTTTTQAASPAEDDKTGSVNAALEIYRVVHDAWVAGNMDEVAKYATKAKAKRYGEMKRYDLGGLLSKAAAGMTTSILPHSYQAVDSFVSPRADVCTLSLKSTDKDHPRTTGEVFFVKEDGEWKIEKIRWKREKERGLSESVEAF